MLANYFANFKVTWVAALTEKLFTIREQDSDISLADIFRSRYTV